jgi:hypothetical protein
VAGFRRPCGRSGASREAQRTEQEFSAAFILLSCSFSSMSRKKVNKTEEKEPPPSETLDADSPLYAEILRDFLVVPHSIPIPVANVTLVGAARDVTRAGVTSFMQSVAEQAKKKKPVLFLSLPFLPFPSIILLTFFSGRAHIWHFIGQSSPSYDACPPQCCFVWEQRRSCCYRYVEAR